MQTKPRKRKPEKVETERRASKLGAGNEEHRSDIGKAHIDEKTIFPLKSK
jgi:hypothetical protein